MHQFPAWKYWLVAIVLALGIVFSLPNVFGMNPALNIARLNRQPIDTQAQEALIASIKSENIAVRDSHADDGRLVLRFATREDRDGARELLSKQIANEFSVAIASESAAPRWLLAMGLKPMALGLDLRGGVRFLYEVDVEGALTQSVERLERSIHSVLREARIPFSAAEPERGAVKLTLRSPEQLTAAVEAIRKAETGIVVDSSGDQGAVIVVRLTPEALKQRQDGAIEQNIVTLRNRVNELGVSESSVVRQGRERIEIQLPGVDDPNQALRVISSTTTLEWHMLDEVNEPYEAERSRRVPVGSKLVKDREGRPLLLKRQLIVSGSQMTDATSGPYDNGLPAVQVMLNGPGGKAMYKNTSENVNRQMTVLSVEKTRVEPNEPCDGVRSEGWCTEETVISNARINGVFGDRFIITGLGNDEANELALLLRAGSLETPIDLVSQKQIGATLGQDNIDAGINAMLIGMGLTFVFLGLYYRLFGVIACVVLAGNVVLLAGTMSIIGAVLTLPGIAGIVLTVGMAADANILIYERIREELRIGNSPQAAIGAGFEKAFSAILDSNVTTFIAGIMLFAIGTGPVKGFAVTLMLGIATSIFTATLGSRVLIQLIWGGRRKLAALSV